MSAIIQNFNISQGETLSSPLTLQLPGIPVSDSSGNTLLGSPNVTVINTSAYSVGQSISGPGVPAGAIIETVVSSTQLTLTLPCKITAAGVTFVIGAFTAINLTSVQFLFTAKTVVPPNPALTPAQTQAQAFSLPDTDSVSQGVYSLNWTESGTPLLGQTTLTIPDTITQQMQPGNWFYLIRVVGAPGLPASSNYQFGVINVFQPVSSRIT